MSTPFVPRDPRPFVPFPLIPRGGSISALGYTCVHGGEACGQLHASAHEAACFPRGSVHSAFVRVDADGMVLGIRSERVTDPQQAPARDCFPCVVYAPTAAEILEAREIRTLPRGDERTRRQQALKARQEARGGWWHTTSERLQREALAEQRLAQEACLTGQSGPS